jgi:hypothetical protein
LADLVSTDDATETELLWFNLKGFSYQARHTYLQSFQIARFTLASLEQMSNGAPSMKSLKIWSREEVVHPIPRAVLPFLSRLERLAWLPRSDVNGCGIGTCGLPLRALASTIRTHYGRSQRCWAMFHRPDSSDLWLFVAVRLWRQEMLTSMQETR